MLIERFHQSLLSLRDPDNKVVWATPSFFLFIDNIVKFLTIFEVSNTDKVCATLQIKQLFIEPALRFSLTMAMVLLLIFFQ